MFAASAEECGVIAAMAGAAVVQISGALVPEAMEPIKRRLDAWS